MGYQQEVVERVVKETGQTEDTFLVLEKIVEETRRCEEGSKIVEKRQLNSVRASDTSSSSSSSSTVSRFREKDRELSRALVESGRSKENIKPNHHGGSSNGLGHRRQCSGSETSIQQVYFFIKMIIISEFDVMFFFLFCCKTAEFNLPTWIMRWWKTNLPFFKFSGLL